MIGFVIILVTLALLAVGRQSLKKWALGTALGAVVSLILDVLGILPGDFNLVFLAAGFGAGIGTVLTWGKPPSLKPLLAFDANFQHDHMALTTDGRIWIRDTVSGHEALLAPADVLKWTHLWLANGRYKALNRIELRTTSLEHPVLTAAFNRHKDTLWGAPKNAAEAEEWHARLSALLHS